MSDSASEKKDIPSGDNSEEFVWNFAIGSNMNSKILEGRRQLQPAEKVAGLCRDHRLGFPLLAIPYFEPSMAAIVPQVGSIIHGVLARFTKKQFDHLYQTEGGPTGDYHLLNVLVEAYDGRKIKAIAFAHKGFETDRPEDEGIPSTRYMSIILEGAKESKLDPNYITELEKIPAYKSSLLVKGVALLSHLPLIILSVIVMASNFLLFRFFKLKILGWANSLALRTLRTVMWFTHDLFLSKILGNGGRTQQQFYKKLKEQ
jgi:hypothetical protein